MQDQRGTAAAVQIHVGRADARGKAFFCHYFKITRLKFFLPRRRTTPLRSSSPSNALAMSVTFFLSAQDAALLDVAPRVAAGSAETAQHEEAHNVGLAVYEVTLRK